MRCVAQGKKDMLHFFPAHPRHNERSANYRHEYHRHRQYVWLWCTLTLARSIPLALLMQCEWALKFGSQSDSTLAYIMSADFSSLYGALDVPTCYLCKLLQAFIPCQRPFSRMSAIQRSVVFLVP